MSKDKDKKTIHFWFGEDSFSIFEELQKIKDVFAKKYSDMNIFEIDWKFADMDERERMSKLQIALSSDSLFSAEKLLVLKNTLASKKKKKDEVGGQEEESNDQGEIILKYLAKPKDGIDLFIIEKEVDQRKKIYKELVKLKKIGLAEVREFVLPVDKDFDSWVQKRIEMQEGKLEKGVLNALSIALGKGFSQRDRNKKVTQSYDLWEVENEINKLVNYADNRAITAEDVDLLIRSKVDMNIFSLTDCISQKNKRKAVLLLASQIEKGANEIYILTMLVRQFRNMLIIKDLLEKGLSIYEVTQRSKMHPFVVKKTIEQCRNFSLSDIKKIYQKLYDADLAIKTGKMDPALALDLLVVSVA